MEQLCPISFKQANERAVQVNAALAALSVLLFFFTSQKWIILLLCIDFLIRGFVNPAYSLYGAVSRAILRGLRIKPLMVNAQPKIFAAKIGFIFCCVIALSYLSGFQGISRVLGALLIIFAALEAIFRFCIACRIYPFICKHR